MTKAVVKVALLVFALMLALALPPQPELLAIAGHLQMHSLLEISSIVIAMLIFAVGWQAYSRELPRNIVLLSCMFLGVALLNASHILSFPGMPDFVTANGMEKAINFGFATRSLAAVALLMLVLAPWRPLASASTRYAMLLAVLGAALFAHWLFLFHPEVVPRTFLSRQGLTAVQSCRGIRADRAQPHYGTCAGGAHEKTTAFRRSGLVRCGEYHGTERSFLYPYSSAADVYNLLGHVYKVASYLFIYEAFMSRPSEVPTANCGQRRTSCMPHLKPSRTCFGLKTQMAPTSSATAIRPPLRGKGGRCGGQDRLRLRETGIMPTRSGRATARPWWLSSLISVKNG